jgi:hypothetical protein
LHGISDGRTVFVELKVTESYSISISPFQKAWNFNHVLHGGRSFIMLQHLGERALYIFPCYLLHSASSITLKSAPHYRVEWPLAAPAWEGVVDHLLNWHLLAAGAAHQFSISIGEDPDTRVYIRDMVQPTPS